MRKHLIRQNRTPLVLVLGTVIILGGYWFIQQQKISSFQKQIDQLQNSEGKVLLVKDRIALENTIIGSLIQTIGGLLLFVTAYVSLQNLKATQENVSIAQRNLLVSEEKQVTERFTQAINQLGSDKIEIRFGGIYALERIARDSPKDHWTIMEVLTSFIQENSPLLGAEQERELRSINIGRSENIEKPLLKVTKDVQAALSVIGRRESQNDPTSKRLDLNGVFLRGANLCGANLDSANLRQTNLSGANLSEANLRGAELCGVNLTEACLDEANLTEARLRSANLSKTSFRGADLSGANLRDTNLSDADLHDATLSDTNIRDADIAGAFLESSKELTLEQIKTAKNWESAFT
jgi:uncharacterized protein YjbI with pentapeptide repeats